MYRFRILDASNVRDYELALSSGQDFIQIASDSGLLPAPVNRSSIVIGPAERLEFVIDFSGRLGQNIVLQNLNGSGSTAQIMQFRVTRDLTEDSSVPAVLRALPDVGTPTVSRSFLFNRAGGQWSINGQPFDPNRIDARPSLNTTEEWTLDNGGGWIHMIHIHDVDQQCVSRNGAACPAYETMKETWNIGGRISTYS